MHIHYNTNQTILPLELSSYLPQDHIVFTIEKVVNELEEDCFDDFYRTFGRPSYHPKIIFDKKQKGSQKQSPKNLDNWLNDDISDTYTHPDGWDYHFDYVKHSRTTTGFEQEIRVYKANYSELVPQKGLYVNQRYQKLKRKERQALLSEEGSRIFAQRKVEVEPVFGQIKACLGYKRCQIRGKRQVKIDMGLVLMANNLLKYNTRMIRH
ncbi:transposase [Streptococcus pluranimalium]